MSTDVYGIKVLSVEEDTVTLKVLNVYRDWMGYFPSPYNPFFFFMVLGERCWHLPSEIVTYIESLNKEGWYKEEFIFANATKYIESVEIIDFENLLEDMQYTFYYEKDGKWDGENKLPAITYKVKVTEPKILEHLKLGLSWGTTSYETEWQFAQEEKTDIDITTLHNLGDLFEYLNSTVARKIIAAIGQLESKKSFFTQLLGDTHYYKLFVNRLLFLLNDKTLMSWGWNSQILVLLARLKYTPLLSYMCVKVASVEQGRKVRHSENLPSIEEINSNPLHHQLRNYLIVASLIGFEGNKKTEVFFENYYSLESTHPDAKLILSYALFIATKDLKYFDYFKSSLLVKANSGNDEDLDFIYLIITDIFKVDAKNTNQYFGEVIKLLMEVDNETARSSYNDDLLLVLKS